MSRIDATLAGLKERREKALALFVTAGYPELTSTIPIVRALEQGGADIIEIGMPFSDPLADGPVIQESSFIALKNGITLARVLEDVANIRKRSTIPIVLMGYLNPIMAFGEARFFRAMRDAGADGIILPELPLEESSRLSSVIGENQLSQILLVAPTTSDERLAAIDRASSGFLYCVSTTGVTGGGNRTPAQAYIRRVKEHAKRNQVLVGFGISTPDEARARAQDADGVVVGSALIKMLGKGFAGRDLTGWVCAMKSALS